MALTLMSLLGIVESFIFSYTRIHIRKFKLFFVVFSLVLNINNAIQNLKKKARAFVKRLAVFEAISIAFLSINPLLRPQLLLILFDLLYFMPKRIISLGLTERAVQEIDKTSKALGMSRSELIEFLAKKGFDFSDDLKSKVNRISKLQEEAKERIENGKSEAVG